MFSKRCLIPSSGFYEWKQGEGKKEKYLIRVTGEKLFYMAGLYNTFPDKQGNPFTGFVIITAEANERMLEIHNRMPVILNPESAEIWLNHSLTDPAEIKKLLRPLDNEALEFLKAG